METLFQPYKVSYLAQKRHEGTVEGINLGKMSIWKEHKPYDFKYDFSEVGKQTMERSVTKSVACGWM